MEQKDSKIFNKTTMQAVSAFCDVNNIEDKDDFIYLCFKQGFDIKKFGLLGETLNEGKKDLKTGGIEEIRVEVPVEVIISTVGSSKIMSKLRLSSSNSSSFLDISSSNCLIFNNSSFSPLLSLMYSIFVTTFSTSLITSTGTSTRISLL